MGSVERRSPERAAVTVAKAGEPTGNSAANVTLFVPGTDASRSTRSEITGRVARCDPGSDTWKVTTPWASRPGLDRRAERKLRPTIPDTVSNVNTMANWAAASPARNRPAPADPDRKSTRLNSSHLGI